MPGQDSKNQDQKPFAIIELKRPINAPGGRPPESASKIEKGVFSALKGSNPASGNENCLPQARNNQKKNSSTLITAESTPRVHSKPYFMGSQQTQYGQGFDQTQGISILKDNFSSRAKKDEQSHKTVGQYIILSKLGQGGFGIIYRVRSLSKFLVFLIPYIGTF